MSQGFDQLARRMAEPTSRRGVLKALGAGAAGAVAATFLKPFRGDAVTCPAGTAACGPGCCPPGGVCTDSVAGCCCPAGSTPCGPSCCSSGVACIDRARGLCGCPAGTTQCTAGGAVRCCKAGQTCSVSCPTAAQNTPRTCTSSTCKPPGGSCNFGGDCCSGFCNGNTCACVYGANCATDADCCSTQVCHGGTCVQGPCHHPGGSCQAGGDCCSKFCNGNVCACVYGGSCTTTADCCVGTCKSGTCT